MVAKKEPKGVKISLIDFRVKNNIHSMEYVGLKSLLGLNKPLDDFNIDYTEEELFKALKKFKEMPGFIKVKKG